MVYKLIDSTEAPLAGFNLDQSPRGIRSKQPFRTLFFLLSVAESLFIQLPIRTVLYILLPRLTRPHPKWPLLRSLFISIFRNLRIRVSPLAQRSNVTDKTILPRMGPKDDATPIWIQPINRQTGLQGDLKQYFDAGACTTARVLAFWYGKDHAGKGSRRAQPNEKVYLYFHGGGYYEQSSHPNNPTMNCMRILLNASKKSINKSAPKRGLAIDYRLTNETTFPGIVADALAGWSHLVREGFEPKNIVIGGDSAGGNLALALTRYIRDFRPLFDEFDISKEDPIADSLILLSPWIDISLSLGESGPSASSKRNKKTDFLHDKGMVTARNAIVKGLPIPAVYSRWISCISTAREIEQDLFDDFPRAIVFGGTLEYLIDEIRAFQGYYKATADAGRCGKITYVEEPLASHDWCAVPIGFAAEQKKTMEKISRWI